MNSATDTHPSPHLPIELYEMFNHPRLPTLVEVLEASDARKAQGPWGPASGGTETPFRARSGATLLYCWQPSTGRHAYLDCGTDLILTDEEARLHLGTW